MAYDPLFSGDRHGHGRKVFTMPVIVATIPTNACALVAAVSGGMKRQSGAVTGNRTLLLWVEAIRLYQSAITAKK